MQILIDTSTAYYGAGPGFAHRQLKITDGPYSGRKIVIYNSAPNTIKFSYADAPYTFWSTPEVVSTATADFPADACIDALGNVYLVYTAQTTLNLMFRKLSFGAGTWSVGSEVAVYDDKDNFFPSITRDAVGRLHVVWTCYDSGTGLQTLRHKRSTSDGAAWGSGSSDPGTALTTGAVACYGRIVYLSSACYCIYTDGGTKLATRRLLEGAVNFEAEIVLYQGVFLGERLCVAISDPAALIGVAFEALYKLWYIEFDGKNWSGVFEIANAPATAPLLLFNGAIPCVMYGFDLGSGQIEVRYRYKNGTGFDPESSLSPELKRFEWVYAYDDSAAQKFWGRELEAASATAADVFHPTSGKLVEVNNDAVYLGGAGPFAEANFVLSTTGVGGSVAWQYFDGTNWRDFTPSSGAYHFDAATRRVHFWADSAAVPGDWQKNTIQLHSAYWLRAVVTSPFTTPPVGSQITPLPQINYLSN